LETETKQYDYIIAGMGAAGLSLAMQLLKSSVSFNKILLIDRDLKNKNDRTWCFWTKEKHAWYKDIVFKDWNQFEFKSNTFQKRFDIQPYSYHMIKGIDFYQYCLDEIKKDARFEIRTVEILELKSENNLGILVTKSDVYQAKYIFNSAFRNNRIQKNDINYVQHFKGWVIETETDSFDETCPVFMDFRTKQFKDCRFFYVIPFSKTKALVEYTGFSPKPISSEEYDVNLKNYIEIKLNIQHYKIDETEYGEIPMMESDFVNPFGKNVINIGTAGGNSKPSTGYTFYFIQKSIKKIVTQLKNNQSISVLKNNPKFKFYDKVLLDVIDKNKVEADVLFSALFENNRILTLLTFLNEETSLIKDLEIFNSVPRFAFTSSSITKALNV
jgi:lycopene beta-cyclase